MQELFDRAGDSYETKPISDAVINLYATHIHSLLYPYKHPIISDALRNAFQGLQKVFRRKPSIYLETSEGRLMVDGKVLDGDVLVLGHFASWLNSRNIRALSFARELTRRELIAFHKIISTKKLTAEELSNAMAEKSIVNISVHPVNVSADHHEGTASPDDTAHKGLIKDYENTMYHIESSQAQSPFFIRPPGAGPHGDAAKYGLNKDYESGIYQSENSRGLSSFGTDSGGESSTQEMPEGDRYADCVEALLEHEISEDDDIVIRGIPPLEMAHLLNSMLFRAPGGEVVDRVIRTYFNRVGEMRGEDAVERCRIFFTELRSDLRTPFLSRSASLFSTDNLFANLDPDILIGAVQGTYEPSVTEADADMPHEHPAFVPSRTIEGSDFSFDFVACGNAVIHDIEIPKETASLFNEAHLAYFQNEGALDALSSSVRPKAGEKGLQAMIIAECAEEAITDASFDVVLEIIESNSLDDDAYQKLEGRIASFVELFSEKGEFEKVIDLFNSLKAQSLQGKWSHHAAAMIRRIFSSDKVNVKVVDALRQYGRKQRDIAFKLTSALRSFIIPYLLDALCEESDTSTRRFIMSLLTSVRSEAVDHIARRLRDSSWYVVRNMLYLLRECRGRSYMSAVRDFLEHEVPLIRLEALRTLLSFQDPEADAYVKKFLWSDVFQLQKGAVRLTGAYRIKYAVPHLVRLLREKDIRGKKSHFKKGIIRALGRIGDSSALHHFLNFCRETSDLHNVEFDKLRIEIFKTLHNYPAATIGSLIDYGMHSANEEIVAISKKLMKRYGLSTVKQG